MSLPKFLCVEDDPTVSASVARLLHADFQVLAAHTFEEALLQLDRHPDIAIVLADQHLPGGQKGLDLLAKVQVKAPDAVRAVFSGQIDLRDMVGAINTNLLHRFILKPWENEYFRLQMLEALAVHTTLKQKSELEQLSVTDPVTGLKNHRYFQDRLRIEVERSQRHSRPLALFMIDIDHFKHVNDQHGHPVGDLVLRSVALRIVDQLRSIDTVARYGGEEFAAILPETIAEDAMRVAERIRSAVAEAAFQFPNVPPIAITISLGVASFPLHSTSAQDLIARADQALYQAKSQGRNQTVGAQAP